MTYFTPEPLSIVGETSPVYAPPSSQNTSCAPKLIYFLYVCEMSVSHGNVGQTTVSTRDNFLAAAKVAKNSVSALAYVLGLIFQFAIMSFLLIAHIVTFLCILFKDCPSPT